MAPLTAGATLATRVTDQSPYFFIALGIDMAFLDEPAQDWPQIPAFIKFSNLVNFFPLTNDATERAIKRTSDYIEYGNKGEADLQAFLSTVEKAIAMVPNRRTRAALISAYT